MVAFIYVDNSNVWIEGQRANAALRGQLGPDGQPTQDISWRYDFGALYSIAAGDADAIGRSLLIGSRPPANDSLWALAESRGFEVEVFDRNASNKEKRVDTGIATRIVADAYEHMVPRGADATAVIVAGDGDYVPPVQQLKRLNIHIHVVFWSHGLSADLRALADEYVNLDDHLACLTRE